MDSVEVKNKKDLERKDAYINSLKNISPFKGTRYEKACLSKINFDDNDSILLSKWIDSPRDILYIYSPPGVGKTYFCAALLNYFIDKAWQSVFKKEKDLFIELQIQISEHRSADYLLQQISNYSILMIDDLGSTRSSPDGINLTEWQKEQIFYIVDHRIDFRMPTVITSNYSPNDLKSVFHERFISRIKSKDNTIIELKGPDYRLGER